MKQYLKLFFQDSALEHANLANLELQKNIKVYQDRIKEKTLEFDQEQQAKESTREAMLLAERRANAVQNALEEAKTMLEQSDRARKLAEQVISGIPDSTRMDLLTYV